MKTVWETRLEALYATMSNGIEASDRPAAVALMDAVTFMNEHKMFGTNVIGRSALAAARRIIERNP